MENIELLGIVAGILTTSGFLPQIVKTYKSKSAKDISLGMFSMFVAGIILWLIYGFTVRSLSIILTNSFTLIFSLVMIFFKFKYKD